VSAVRIRAAVLLEGLRLDEPLSFPPFEVSPVPKERKFIGRDGREIFNAELAQAGFVTEVDAPGWGVQLWPRKQLAFAICQPLEGDVHISFAVAALANQLADLVTLSHGGEPRVVACAFEASEDQEQSWRPIVLMVGGGRQPGTALDRLAHASGLPSLDPTAVWDRAASDVRFSLWLSLFRSAASEPRWDAQMFRVCALLETVAATGVSISAEPLRDSRGRGLLGHNGQPATTQAARGRLYVLLRDSLSALEMDERPLLSHPAHSLWDEVGIWLDVRNAVAHEGGWSPPPLNTQHPGRRDRVAAAFSATARGGGLDSGWLRYAEASVAGAEAVLRAALLGGIELGGE